MTFLVERIYELFTLFLVACVIGDILGSVVKNKGIYMDWVSRIQNRRGK